MGRSSLLFNSLHAVRESLVTSLKHAPGANWFSESPFCLRLQTPGKGQGPTTGGLAGGMGEGGWGFPQLPAERNGGVFPPLCSHSQGQGSWGAPLHFLSPHRSIKERGSHVAHCTGSSPALRSAWPPPSRPPIPGAPVASAQSPVPVPVDPALRPLPSVTRRRFPPPLTQPGRSPPRLPPAPPPTSAACPDLR